MGDTALGDADLLDLAWEGNKKSIRASTIPTDGRPWVRRLDSTMKQRRKKLNIFIKIK